MIARQLDQLAGLASRHAQEVAQGAVRTTGINWESVAATAAIVGVLLPFILWIFNRQDKRREQINKELRDDMTNALNHLSDVLMAKLETKDTVARISERLGRVEAVMGVGPAGNHTG